MIEVEFYDSIDDKLLKFAVIISKTNGKWIFCKHRERDTYEVPGGHRESGEDILSTAKRELMEETGATDFTIKPICVYSVKGKTRVSESIDDETFGMLFFADVFSFEEIHSEIEKILITDDLVENWTYAAFGDAYIDSVAKEIQEAFPGIKGFNRRGLYRMKKFYETYCDDEFVTTLLTQISWSNHLAIMSKAKTAEERHFYMALCIKEAYSARELDRQINSGYYERCESGRIRRHRRKNRHQNRRQRQVC